MPNPTLESNSDPYVPEASLLITALIGQLIKINIYHYMTKKFIEVF